MPTPKDRAKKPPKGKLTRSGYDGYDLSDEFEDDTPDSAWYDKYAARVETPGDDFDCSDYDGNTYGAK